MQSPQPLRLPRPSSHQRKRGYLHSFGVLAVFCGSTSPSLFLRRYFPFPPPLRIRPVPGRFGYATPFHLPSNRTILHQTSQPMFGWLQRSYMEILGTILIGLLVGIVAKLLMPGRDPGGFIITTLLGIAGAFVAKYIGQALGWYSEGQSAGFLASVVGAIILLALYRITFGRARTP